MYRLNYNELKLQQVKDIVSKKEAPVVASEFCGYLVGKSLKIVLDKTPVAGPQLEYEFQSDAKLTLKENSGPAIACDYAAQTLKDVTLFSHMIPDTMRGYNVIVNWKTSVVTVFEMWFLDYEGEKIDTTKTFIPLSDSAALGKVKPYVNREVQRQYYFGYIDEPGKSPPEGRDHISLRLENSMIKWKEDRGKKRLTTYTSLTYSTIIELDTPDGGDVLTFSSDVLRIDESMYIHCFGEIEYSGRLTVEVLDLYSLRKVGVTVGIDEDDKFEHALYKGHGKFLGRFTTFQDFNDRGATYSELAARQVDYSVKGARASFRPSIMTIAVTEEHVAKAAQNTMIFDKERAKERVMSSAHLPPDSDYCVGKELAFRGDDSFAVELRFKAIDELEYRIAGDSAWNAETYCAFELDEDLIILSFYRSGSNPPASLFFALDFQNGLATCISTKMGSKNDWHDPEPAYHFGVMDMKGLTPVRIFRQGFTDELLGRAFTQTYSDAMSSIHIYSAPHSYSWTIITNGAVGSAGNRSGYAVWSSPCEYIKLRDDVYIMNWVEQKWSGHMDTLCRNLRTGRDCGFGYGMSNDGAAIYMDRTGSISREAGRVDLGGVFSLRNYDVMS
ncbi:MAG: MoaF N-terminal domain-containing protein [Oscillospiraceae bacterium]|nr:MoaF N-terminal domain-containing protein [Oscillospiraceae bacterium]